MALGMGCGNSTVMGIVFVYTVAVCINEICWDKLHDITFNWFSKHICIFPIHTYASMRELKIFIAHEWEGKK